MSGAKVLHDRIAGLLVCLQSSGVQPKVLLQSSTRLVQQRSNQNTVWQLGTCLPFVLHLQGFPSIKVLLKHCAELNLKSNSCVNNEVAFVASDKANGCKAFSRFQGRCCPRSGEPPNVQTLSQVGLKASEVSWRKVL